MYLTIYHIKGVSLNKPAESCCKEVGNSVIANLHIYHQYQFKQNYNTLVYPLYITQKHPDVKKGNFIKLVVPAVFLRVLWFMHAHLNEW